MTSHRATPSIRVVRVIGRLNVGGSALHVVNLSADLDSNRFKQVLVCGTEKPSEGSMLDYASCRGIQPVVIPQIVTEFGLGLKDLKAFAKLYRLIRRERPHIVDTHTAKAGFLGRLAGRLAGVPIIIHTYHGHVLRGYYGPMKTWLLRRMEQALARLTDCIIAVSEQVKRDLVAYRVATPQKILVMPLGFELAPFLSCKDQQGQFRHELGVTENTPLVGIIGRICPIKNHRLFLDAAAQVAACEPRTHFAIVGDGALRADMEQYTRELNIDNRVIFTGWRRDLPRIYADLNVLVVSSDNEGTPVAVIEAMAAGCPVVATNVGGLPDLIADGQTGYLVLPGDPEALATAILRLLRDPDTASGMAQRGQGKARQYFAIERLINDVEKLYTQLLSENDNDS